MVRKIVNIDKAKCNGCGLCATACHEGAIGIIDGKAVLLREDYCDGLGDCLPSCPTGAITFVEREAAEYDEAAVIANKKAKSFSRLNNFPVQLKLVPIKAPYFSGAELLVAADCTAFAYCSIHSDFMAGRVTLIGCPKLDSVDYSEKIAEIFRNNDIRGVTVVRMEVPCCGGLSFAVRRANEKSGKNIPLKVVVISTDGIIVGEE